jgi:hypothetical protein
MIRYHGPEKKKGGEKIGVAKREKVGTYVNGG